jgi:hypothetical protein
MVPSSGRTSRLTVADILDERVLLRFFRRGLAALLGE